MHSYREAFEDSEADRVTHSPTYGGGGENSPQTPRFPVSPQTPYFNTCRSAFSKSLNTPVFAFYLFIFSTLYKPRTNQRNREVRAVQRVTADLGTSSCIFTSVAHLVTDEGKFVATVTGFPLASNNSRT